MTREAAISYSWVGCTCTVVGGRPFGKGHAPGKIGGHAVVVAPEEAAHPADRVAYGHRRTHPSP